ncbi:MAG: hypothetical protein AMXMBFR48_03630 [Ignavibacteriales bacterium]
MIKPAIPENEENRLQELYSLQLHQTGYEENYQNLVQLASAICGTPVSLISLIDRNKQWFKAGKGIEATEAPRDVSFCAHAINQSEIFEIQDALEDERFHDNPLVTGSPNIRFYAGVPIYSPGGYCLGTICVVDSVPHNLTDEQKFALKTLARQVETMFRLRQSVIQLDAHNKDLFEKKSRIKDLLEEREKHISVLSEQSRLKSKFLSILAHDIKSPLASIHSVLELISNGSLSPDEIKELTGMIQQNINATSSLLSNILQWAWAGISGESQSLEPVNLTAKAFEAVSEAEPSARKKGNEIVTAIPSGLMVMGRNEWLLLILRNLITNANKFTSNGRIFIHASTSGPEAVITVKDTGIGMTAETSEKILSGGVIRPGVGTNKEGGSGIGLMLTRDFIEKMGGNLTLSSEPGEGSVFSFTVKAVLSH